MRDGSRYATHLSRSDISGEPPEEFPVEPFGGSSAGSLQRRPDRPEGVRSRVGEKSRQVPKGGKLVDRRVDFRFIV
jgi:hypothetical protein